jgi:hypothetical protein
MALKIKTWKHNLWECVKIVLFGIPIGLIGLSMLIEYFDGTRGFFITNGVPIPLVIIAIILTAGGIIMVLLGLFVLYETLHRKLFKGDVDYYYTILSGKY